MKYLTLVFVILINACGSEVNQNDVPVFSFATQTTKPLEINDIQKTTNFDLSISLPIPICTNDSSLILYDFSDSKIKMLNRNGFSIAIHPLGNGDNTLGGAYFEGVGFSLAKDKLLIGSNTIIKEYDLLRQKFGNQKDEFSDCPSFNDYFSEIIHLDIQGNEIMISQHGEPCINAPRDGMAFSVYEFASIQFLRINSLSKNKVVYTFNIPPQNQILGNGQLYVETRPLLSFNKKTGSFFAIINPTNQLYEFRLNPSNLEFELLKKWNLDLPHCNLPVNYTLNSGIDRELTDEAMKYNFELKKIKAVDDYTVLSYRPSKSRAVKDLRETKFPHHYLLAILNHKDESTKVYSLDYEKIDYLGCLDNGDLWFYDIEGSEMSNTLVSKIKIVNIAELL